MKIDVITLFPDMINSLLAEGVIARAINNKIIELNTTNPRYFSTNVHNSVDDRPYGGGAGMVMNYDCISQALAEIESKNGRGFRIFFSPQGKKLDHQLVEQLSQKSHLVMLCGRYEGIDERIITEHIDLECSIGDYVLSGGELAAAVLIDSVSRLLPDVLGHEDSAKFDSFATGLLDYPHYTRPELVNGKAVPKVLISGDHKRIDNYRLQQALGNTWIKRPDLFAKRALSEEELCLLNDFLKTFRNNKSCGEHYE